MIEDSLKKLKQINRELDFIEATETDRIWIAIRELQERVDVLCGKYYEKK